MGAVHVTLLGLGQSFLAGILTRCHIVHRVKTATDEPFLIITGIGAKAAPQNQQFDLIGRVAHGFQGLDAVMHLEEGIKIIFHAPLGPWFFTEITLGERILLRAKMQFPGQG